RPRGVQVRPNAVQRLTRVPRAEPLELAIEAVARTHLDLTVAHARVEAVERPRRRAADAAAEQVVDAAVTGADEGLRSVLVGDRAADMRAARRERDVPVPLVRLVDVDLRIAPTHEDRRLADVADA